MIITSFQSINGYCTRNYVQKYISNVAIIVVCVWGGGWGWGFGPCFVVQYLVSFIVLQSSLWGRERAGCFTSNCLLMSCGYYCSMSLRYGAVGWSTLCDCGISRSYSFCNDIPNYYKFEKEVWLLALPRSTRCV